jgi:hypothetical protein
VPIYIAAFIASSLLLFLPEAAATLLGLVDFTHTYREYLGGTFVVSLSLLIAYGLVSVIQFATDWLDARRFRRHTLRALRSLTDPEKEFLRLFIVGGENTRYAPISDGITGGLVAKRLIYRSSNIVERFNAPYNLQPPVRELLMSNPYLLEYNLT